MNCDHEGCRCQEATLLQAGKHFCSQPCADAETTDEPVNACGCEHPDCAPL